MSESKPSTPPELQPAHQLALWQILLAMFPVAVIAFFVSRHNETRAIQWRPFTETAFQQEIGDGKTVVLFCSANWNQNSWEIENYVFDRWRVKRWMNTNRVAALRINAQNPLETVKVNGRWRFGWSGDAVAIFPNGDVENPIVMKGKLTATEFLDRVARIE